MSDAKILKLLGISGSLRAKSFNTAALHVVGSALPPATSFEIADISALPFYNADVEQHGFPAAVETLRDKVRSADALVFAVPEYNFAIPGVLKNALEWLSRPPGPPANAKPCAILGATVSPLGTARGQFNLRQICVSLNMMPVNTPHVDITSAATKYDAEGRLADAPTREAIARLVSELHALALRLGERSA